MPPRPQMTATRRYPTFLMSTRCFVRDRSTRSPLILT
jgi:hypothetical protein